MPANAQSDTGNSPVSSKQKMMANLRSTFVQKGSTSISGQINKSISADLDVLEQAISQAEQQQVETPVEPVESQESVSQPVDPQLESVPTALSEQNAPAEPQEMTSMAQVVPQVAMQQTDTLNPQSVSSPVKEQEPIAAPQELNISTANTEVEPNREMELPVEVESYVERVTDHSDQLPAEIVVADDGADISTKTYPSKPVVVLPITQKEEKEGENKSTAFSIRWLVEFSRKLMKAFSGAVIYREEDE